MVCEFLRGVVPCFVSSAGVCRRRCVLVTPVLEFDLVGFSSWSSCCLLFLAYVSLFVSGGSSFVVAYVWFSQDL